MVRKRYELMTDETVAGGFAVVQPDSQLSINAVEAYTLDEFSPEAVRSQLAESQKIASGSGSEADIAEAKIEVEVRHLARQNGQGILTAHDRFLSLFRLP
jgi:F0F1-type ATP synthase epsilon subunit